MAEYGQVLVGEDSQDCRVRKPDTLEPLTQLRDVLRYLHSSSMPMAG
jgi:hypothetical protein